MDIEVFYKINSYLYDNKGIKQGNETAWLSKIQLINYISVFQGYILICFTLRIESPQQQNDANC